MGNESKHEEMVFHEDTPSNAETPPSLLRENFVTPTDLFFCRNHATFPAIQTDSYRLSIGGLVDKPCELSIDEIKQFPKTTVGATLQCAGNRRDGLSAFKDIPGETQWRTGAIGNAQWSGAALRDVLRAAGIGEGALYVGFEALDLVEDEEETHFGASIPLEKALSSEVILAYAMNGEDLPREHGGPLRAIVPGYTGARSVKWLSEIELREVPSENYYQAHDYRLYAPDVTEENASPENGIALDEALVNSVICEPADKESVKSGRMTVRGYATAGGGRWIERVDVSSDGGETWTQADLLEGRNDPWTWTFWEVSLDSEPGERNLVVRATDSSANTQPENVSQIWNHRGYANNSWHSIRVNAR